MMPAQTRSRPEPADDPGQTTLDRASTPVEDLPAGDPSAPSEPERREEDRARHFDEHHYPAPNPHEALQTAVATVRQMAGPVFGRLPEVDPSLYGPDAVDLEPNPPYSAAEALAEVFRRVQPIAKGRQAEAKAGGYSFRGIDDVYAALHDLFAEVGLVVLPSTIGREREQRPRSSGSGYNYVTHVHVRLRFLASDGSSEELDGWGEGADTGDKSTGKAYSQAIKSALLAAFLIPTEASASDDPDRTNSEESRPFTAEERERAERALGAAVATTTVEELAGVRHRALHLLDVPVQMVNGDAAPLGYLIDEHRRKIEAGS
jgi:hypothetical protein